MLTADQPLWSPRPLTPDGSLTRGAEGPSCDAEGTLYVCNYGAQGVIGRVADGAAEPFLTLPPPSVGNGMVFGADGEMYVADYVGHKVFKVDMATRRLEVLLHEPDMDQPNDLAVMRSGVLFASDPRWSAGTGRLWRIGGGRAAVLEHSMGTVNGLEVSPDERTLYVNESVQRRVWAYDLDAAGFIGNKRLFYRFDDGLLDGMRCDVRGHLYVTRCGLGRVAVLSPGGDLVREVVLGGQDCTNLAFGGPDGRTCFVTLADRGRVEAFRTDAPGRSWALLEAARGRLA